MGTYSNIFVLCTGRCGSLTFAKACAHLSNYTVGHETRRGYVSHRRLCYPLNHIEVDNRLSFCLGALHEEYGSNALYVHLQRDHDDVVNSFLARPESSVIDAWQKGITRTPQLYSHRYLIEDYVSVTNANIRHFLMGKKSLAVDCEYLPSFKDFLAFIKAEGNILKAMETFQRKHN